MHGTIPPLPNTPAWRGAELKHRDNFTITFLLYILNSCSVTIFYDNSIHKILNCVDI
jgi:hypothetical protein